MQAELRLRLTFTYHGCPRIPPHSRIPTAYYDRVLKLKGWQLATVREFRHSSRQFIYCKGNLTASLFYAGTPSTYGWDYAVDLSWGLHECTQ